MGIQETILDLYRQQRLDKALAYRLLSELKEGGAGPAAPAAIPASVEGRANAGEHLRVSCGLEPAQGGAAEPARRELQALAAWAWFLRIVTGREELEIDLVGPARTCRLRVAAGDDRTGADILGALQEQLDRGDAPSAPADLAWVAAGTPDRHPRQLAAHRLPDAGAPGTVLLELRAAPAALGATAATDWADTLRHLDAQLQAAPHARLGTLDRLPERHRRLLAEYNRTTMHLPATRTLPELLGPVLAAEDDRVAIRSTRGDLTYRQFRESAHRLAHLLRRHGVARNERVAVIMHRSAWLPVAFYGVACAGAAYVPIEPDLPPDRIAGILRDTGARLAITDADTLHARQVRFDGGPVERLVCLDRWPRPDCQGLPVDDLGALEEHDPSAPRCVNEPGDLCYVIYTSGSTGKPKGVMIAHEPLVNTLVGVNNVFNVSREDRIFCFSSIGFDLSVWDIFGTALAGATVFIPTKPETRDPAAMMRILREAGITIWNSAPTAMSTLLLPWADRELEVLPSIRLVMLGGEFISRSLFADVQRAFPNAQLANLGGATEGTIWSIFHFPVPRFEPQWASIPYGKPLPNQRFHVLNEELVPCAVGEKGMLWIGGMGVALGYLGDDERTRLCFRQAPWSDDPADRIYRTGDLGIMRADGVIEICGRADHQVKVRGYRVELGEIESALGALDGVDQGAVIARRDASNQIRLVAFYVGRRGEVPASELRRGLTEKLPEYMIPAQFVHLDDPPLGQTGKLDRKALAARDVGRDEVGQAYVQPGDEAERQLATDLARILRLDRVGVEDDFYLIGGDSLTTLLYISALARLGFAASPADIQQGRTIRDVLARVKAAAQGEAPEIALVPYSPMSRKFFERLPLVDRDHWHQLMVIGFDHLPDVPRLGRAMQAVVDNHPLLRARSGSDGLHVERDLRLELRVVDLRGVPRLLRPSRFAEEARRLRATVTLSSPSLANAVLVRLGDRDARLLWVLHHLVVDANCWRTLVDDLATRYRQPDARLLRSASMADYVEAVRRNAPEARELFAHQPRHRRMPIPARRPATHPPFTGLERDTRMVRLVLDPAETARMFQALQRHRDVTLNLVLLTALSTALRDWSTAEVAFDVISNGRSADPTRDYSRTIGWFATHNPFAVTVPDAPGESMAAVRAAWERYQETSRFFVEVCNDVKGRADHPLGDHVDQSLLFSFLGDFDNLELPDGWSVLGTAGTNRGPANPRTHELELEALVARGRLMTRLMYARSVVSGRAARRLVAGFRSGLRAVVAHLEEAARTGAPEPRALPAAAEGEAA